MFNSDPVQHGTLMYVGKVRKDGKYPVTYHFLSTGRRINSIMTADKIRAEIEREKDVRGFNNK